MQLNLWQQRVRRPDNRPMRHTTDLRRLEAKLEEDLWQPVKYL